MNKSIESIKEFMEFSELNHFFQTFPQVITYQRRDTNTNNPPPFAIFKVPRVLIMDNMVLLASFAFNSVFSQIKHVTTL